MTQEELEKRCAICERIIAGDKAARQELADWYCLGMSHYVADSVRRMTESSLRGHAEMIVQARRIVRTQSRGRKNGRKAS